MQQVDAIMLGNSRSMKSQIKLNDAIVSFELEDVILQFTILCTTSRRQDLEREDLVPWACLDI